MSKAIKIDPKTILEKEYITVSDFMLAKELLTPFPFKAEFSFDSFLKNYETKVAIECPAVSDEVVPHISEIANKFENDRTDKHRLHSLIAMCMPSVLLNEEPVFISPPFGGAFVYASKAMEDFLLSGDWELKMNNQGALTQGNQYIKACTQILNKLYDQDLELSLDQVITLRNKKNSLEKHFKMRINAENVEVIATKPLKKISKREILELLRQADNQDLWQKYFPVENFEFKGLAIGSLIDITELEVLSILKQDLILGTEDMTTEDFMLLVKHQTRDFLSKPDIQIGLVAIYFAEIFNGYSYSLTQKVHSEIIFKDREEEQEDIYCKAYRTGKVVLKEDLTSIKNPSVGEQALIDNGYKSVILFPTYDLKNKIGGMIEFGSKRANDFNALTINKMEDFFELLKIGNDRFLQETASRTNNVIQQQFTSIHPSVLWKFEEVANKYQIKKGMMGYKGDIDPIVFKGVYPLYGQADIVSSSTKRNTAIRADLIDNLERVKKLLKLWAKEVNVQLLRAYIKKVELLRKRLETEFISSDESSIIDLLNREIHPLLHKLEKRFDHLSKKAYQEYFDYLDPTLHIVYQQRKDYETAVNRLNIAISNFVEEDNKQLQNILPHYFEKYKTDGIEYNIYVGQSLLQELEYQDYFLKEFRLSQLVQMCEITRLVEQLSSELPLPLKTAQLIFVYNNALSIRFRMDEKQFDVDGTYNVRYEILKKRIDKAYVKGTKERLTQAGKVAIVYMQEKDRREYMEYIEYLISESYIDANYEDLELEKLQGADGLKALRLTVI